MEGWARGMLKSLDWMKRKGKTGKWIRRINFLWKRSQRSNETSPQPYWSMIYLKTKLNLDQTALSYASHGKYTFHQKGSPNMRIKGLDDKRQITGTFAVSLTGHFLPIQVNHQGKTQISSKQQIPKTFSRHIYMEPLV